MPTQDPVWSAATREIPQPWAQRATVRRAAAQPAAAQPATVRQRRPVGLRLPAPGDPAPATGRMLGVCAWAALLGVVGIAVAVRAVVGFVAGDPPGWYEPAVLFCGVVGIGLTASAFLAVHQARLPWLLLTGATVPLVVNLAATATAL